MKSKRTSGVIAVICGVAIALLGLPGYGEKKESAPLSRQNRPVYAGTIVAMGDSLTAGLGVNEQDAYPAQLERKLSDAGLPWKVVNAGISGETSSGALSRVNWVLKLKPDIVVLETGANDGLRGIDPRITEKNIDDVLRILKEHHVTIVLAGMEMLRNLGTEYTASFHAIYPRLAARHGVSLVPFFLRGVAGEPALNQRDGMHPTAEGYRIVVRTIYPYVAQAINNREKTR